jgi:hypothetical protein
LIAIDYQLQEVAAAVAAVEVVVVVVVVAVGLRIDHLIYIYQINHHRKLFINLYELKIKL